MEVETHFPRHPQRLTFGRLHSSLAHLFTLLALAGGLLALAPVAQGGRAVSLSLNVNFFTNGAISVTLPDGTPVGSTSGAPTVIPAGFYTFVFSGPGGCTSLPYFHLVGPGVNVVSNLAAGEAQKAADTVNFLPSTTYTWTNDGFPGVVHTFTTSGVVESTPPVAFSPTSSSSGNHSAPVTSKDIVGSEVVPARGTLIGEVGAAGRLTLTFKGKSVRRLKAGLYRITVTDKSSSNGFNLKLDQRAVSVTGTAFVGKHSASVHLTAGKWLVVAGGGATAHAIVVS